MTDLTRRDFLKAVGAVASALGFGGPGMAGLREAIGGEAAQQGFPVVWLQAQGCSGCSVSLMNSIQYGSIADLLVETLDVKFHPTLMAASGALARSAAEDAYDAGGYVLVVEGAIPTAARGAYCSLWDGMTALAGVRRYAGRASFIVGVGTCAAFGGVVAGAPNPTRARGLGSRFAGQRVINIPGCPVHPDWVVGTLAHVIANGEAPALDRYGRPREFFSGKLHEKCPLKGQPEAEALGESGCLAGLGCKGRWCRADCPQRRWNAAAPGEEGVNWCVGAGSPCYGCTEPTFPDGMSPLYQLEPTAKDEWGEAAPPSPTVRASALQPARTPDRLLPARR